jgi:hypothetical protein
MQRLRASGADKEDCSIQEFVMDTARSPLRASLVFWPRIAGLMLVASIIGGLATNALAEVQASRSVEITGEQQHQQFAAGDTVRITAQVADDIFAAGREVTLDGARAHTLVTGAGRLVLRNSTIRDLIAGSLDVEIHGVIEDDAVIAVCPICWWGSRRILIGKDARIGDEARLFADTIVIDGTIGGELRATARRIVISGSIVGKADLKAKEVVIASTARLGGEVIVRSPGKPEIATGATITGPLREVPTKMDFPDVSEWPRRLIWLAVFAALAVALGMLVLGALSQITVPRLVQAGADRLTAQPWTNVGLGLAWALLTPAIAALLFVSLIGVPAGIVLMAGFVVLVALGFVSAGYAAGLWLRQRIKSQPAVLGTWGRVGWTVLGLLALILINIIPFLGWIIALLIFMAGLGAAASAVIDRFRTADAG